MTTRPYDRQWWHTPAKVLGAAPDQSAAEAFRLGGSYSQWLNPQSPGKLIPSYNTSSVVFHPSAKNVSNFYGKVANSTIRVWPEPSQVWDEPARWITLPVQTQQQDKFPFFPHMWQFPIVLPWNNEWLQPTGTTDHLTIITMVDGAWETLGLRKPNLWEIPPLEWRSLGEYQDGDWVCGMLHRRYDTGPKINRGTFEGHGAGLMSKEDGVVRSHMVSSGDIGMRMSLVAFNIETGPAARFIYPATKAEHTTAANAFSSFRPNAPHKLLMPEGTTLASNASRKLLDDRLDARKLTDKAYKQTCRVFWYCLADYGMTADECGHGDAMIECSTMAPGYPERGAWYRLGVTSESRAYRIFEGFPMETLYVVKP